MIDYKLFKDNGLQYNKVKKINSAYVIDTNTGKYVVKKRKEDLDLKFEYLHSRNFNHFPKHFKIGKYDVFTYLNDSDISDEERLYEITNLMGILHSKTTRYKEISLDDYKEIYENILNKIKDLDSYYNNLNTEIDSKIYMSPSQYFLVLNISKIYSALSFARYELDNWYELVKDKEKERIVFIHNNLKLEHLIYDNSPYLISFNKSKVDLPIYDLLNLYKEYYNYDFSNILNLYQKKYPLSTDELKLFFIYISIPKKIEFSNDDFLNIKNIKNMLEHLDKSDKIIRPYYKKETN